MAARCAPRACSSLVGGILRRHTTAQIGAISQQDTFSGALSLPGPALGAGAVHRSPFSDAISHSTVHYSTAHYSTPHYSTVHLSAAGAEHVRCLLGVPQGTVGVWDVEKAQLPFALRGLHSTPGTPQESEKKAEPSKAPETESSPTAGGTYWNLKPQKLYREDGTEWPWHCFTPSSSYRPDTDVPLDKHFKPNNFGDVFAKYLVKAMRIPTDIFFQRRYGCRAMMLETVAAVPGMVAGMLLHLKSLRLIEHSGGWIKTLLDEAENERMHLMTFMEVAQPKWYERALIFSVQAVFFTIYSFTYAFNPRIAHRIVGYLEEEAVHSYTEYLKDIDAGKIENVPAPQIAIDYWRLPKDATLRDVVVVVRADEANHRDVNHFAANIVQEGKKLKDHPAPIHGH